MVSMKEKIPEQSEYYSIDTWLPMKVRVISSEKKNSLQSKVCESYNLKPCIINISGGEVNFKSALDYHEGETLEIIITLTLPSATTICVYGQVIKNTITPDNHYQLTVEYFGIKERIRDMIIRFVFQCERQMLKNTQLSRYQKFKDISLEKLTEGTILPFDLYIKADKGLKFLFSSGLLYNVLAKEFFQEKGISKVYIKKEDVPLLNDYLFKKQIRVRFFEKDDPVQFKQYSIKKKKLHHIDKTLLIPKNEINFSLYTMSDFNFNPFIEADQNLPVLVDENISSAAADILIKNTDIELYRAYLRSLPSVEHIYREDEVSAKILKEKAKIIMHEMIEDSESKTKMAEVLDTVKEIIDRVIDNRDSIYSLLSLNTGDFYSYTHSVNVAVMSIGVGVTLNLRLGALESLGIGAILHDIGHSAIDDEIVNKQGRMTSTEYEIFKTHVYEGLEILGKHDNIPLESYTALLHHHANLTSRGYPFRLSDDKISPFGRIIAMADSYDLLTTNRPYREAQKPFQVLSTLTKEAKGYDSEILAVFIKTLGKIV